jgi:16S rRNA (uracil1498-N3)-methyltransferase
MHVFYSDIADNKMVILNQEESHHCVKVLRLRQGEEVVVTDGHGQWLSGTLIEANHKACLVSGSKLSIVKPRQHRLHLAVAPTKKIDRFEWFLEKATECGIEEITPVFCENSERNVIKPERLEKLMVAAMKQSLRAWLPALNPAIKFKDFLQKEISGVKMIAHCDSGDRKDFKQAYTPSQNAIVLIGPEGDFSEAEVFQAMEAGYQPIKLGNYRLRTETAALVTCIEFNVINGEF